MRHIRSRKHAATPYLAALAALAVVTPVAAMAQEHGEHRGEHHGGRDHDRHGDEDEAVIRGHREGYRATEVSSPKKTQPLLDTPQTLNVIGRQLLDEQNALSLTDALRNTPGITLQLGENGNTASGDTFQMRGFSTQTSLFLDGIRDLGAISRDVFNVEQVEVAKGPAGADIGRGASSGYINLVSKLPNLSGGTNAVVSAFSQGGLRATLDSNMRLSGSSALRLNLMTQDVDAAGRSYVNYSGYGIAPSYAVGLGTDTTFYIFGQYLKQDNVPDGGLPSIGLKGFYNATSALATGARVDRENFYGSPNDYEDVEAAMLSGKIVHHLRHGGTLTNTSRYGKTTMDRILTGINALTAVTPADPSTWTVARTRQRVDQENTILFNQTNYSFAIESGSVRHDLSVGFEVGYESQFNRTYGNAASDPVAHTTTTIVIPAANLYAPNVNDVLPAPLATGAYTDGESTTLAAYAFDTIEIGEQWRVSGGVRIDNYDMTTNVAAAATTTTAPVVTRLEGDGTLVSWNAGVVYKPTPASSLYVSYGNALTPPGGTNFSQSGTASSAANPIFDPQETGSFEAGAKWDVNRRLTLTAAYYNTVAKNELTQEEPVGSGIYIQVGERKVSGFEFSATGIIIPNWQISAGIQTMKTEIEEGTTGNNSAGASTRWSPELTGTVWTSYKVTPKFSAGIGGQYVGEQKRVVDPSANPSVQNMPDIDGYFVANAMATYDLTNRVALQLNVNNLFDEDYVSTLNNSGARLVLGAPRTATLTARVRF